MITWRESPNPVSISDYTSYCTKVSSQSLEAARFVFRIPQSLWNLTGILATVLPMCMSNIKAIRWFKLPILRLWYFMRSFYKTSYRILRRDSVIGSISLLRQIGRKVPLNSVINVFLIISCDFIYRICIFLIEQKDQMMSMKAMWGFRLPTAWIVGTQGRSNIIQNTSYSGQRMLLLGM